MTIQEKLRFMHSTPVVAWHEHIYGGSGGPKGMDPAYIEYTLQMMEFFGIDKIVTSLPIPYDNHCVPEDFIQANNYTYNAVRQCPDRVYGYAFINPGFREAALAEIDRCVGDLGFVGAKLMHQYFIDDPVLYPLVEKCIDLDIPILIHAGHVMDASTKARQVRLSDGVHIASIANRYPEATIIMGHISGGGDWQWSLKAIADCKNVFADIGGSINDRPLIEESVKYLGADRLLFATDTLWSASVGRLLGADISDEDKKTILAGPAFRRYLNRR